MKSFFWLVLVVGCGTPTPETAVSSPPLDSVTVAETTEAESEGEAESGAVDHSETATAEPAVAPSDQPAPGPNDALVWRLRIDPSTFRVGDAGRVRVYISAENNGPEDASPSDVGASLFAVDGEASRTLGMAFGNGIRGPEWLTLRPGQTARDERHGVPITDAPGEHTVTLSGAMGSELARATIHVRP